MKKAYQEENQSSYVTWFFLHLKKIDFVFPPLFHAYCENVRLLCKNYCVLCTQALKVLKGVWFFLEGSVFILNIFCWAVKVSFYFYHFVEGFFCMHFNGYLRVPMCLERNLNICAFFLKASAQCRLFHQYHQMTGSCSWNNM